MSTQPPDTLPADASDGSEAEPNAVPGATAQSGTSPGEVDPAPDAPETRSVPVDFPVYGLHRDIAGPRWVDFFEGGDEHSGGAPWALWLGQRLGETESGLRIGSMPRRRYEQAMCPGGGDPLAEVAFSGAFGLVNLTLPDAAVGRPTGLIETLLAHAEQNARRYETWPRALWRVDGMSVRARIWEFAGGWTGFTGDLDDTYVAVIGIGVSPEGLSLARVEDPRSYGVDFSEPISIGDLGRHRATRAEAWLPPPRRSAFHPDQLALLPAERSADN